jgi:hypothetical protein
VTVTEPTLFPWDEPPLPVRVSDPQTSHAAAVDLQARIRARKREVMAALEVIGSGTASRIKVEMARQGNIREAGTIRSRLNQLKRDGLVRLTGGVENIPTDKGGSGRDEQVWAIVRQEGDL